MRIVNVAVIGYGFMGRAHSNAYRQVVPFFAPRVTPRLKVLCGRTRGNVELAAARLGFEEVATDWRSVVSRKDVDLIDICTPGDSHAEIAVAAAQAGKVVFCEKPLGNSVKEAESMLAAVRKARVVHMVCHNYRRAPAVMLAKTLIAEGRLGTIRHFRGTYLQDWLVDPSFPLLWRLEKSKAASGALGDIGSHVVDLARFLVGDVTEVAGMKATFVKERPLPGQSRKKGKVTVDDAAAALVRFDNGAIGTIEATRLAPGRQNYNRFEVNGSAGSLAFNLERMNELDVQLETDEPALKGFRTILATDRLHPYMKAWWPRGHLIGYEHTFTHTVFDLLEAVADQTLPTPNFEDGLAIQRVLSGIERAADCRKWVLV